MTSLEATAVRTRPLTPSTDVIAERVRSVDLLRGAVMILMVLDHARDLTHEAALRFDPVDLSQTDPATFLTRWITHVVAPAFVLLAGVSARLVADRGTSRGDLARFLLVRGLLLVVLELTVVRVGIWFSLDPSFLGMLQVIWVLGVSMIVLAGLVFLPIPVIGVIGGVMIIGHNLLDRWPAFNSLGWVATLLHAPGALRLFGSPEPNLIVLYPLVPWIGVMATGFVLGGIYRWEAPARRRFLVGAGVALTIVWLGLRFSNIYGDPTPWEAYRDPAKTVMSFFNAEKYPPSLVFLLMTGGPILIVLGLLDGWRPRGVARSVEAIGRAPLFFYLAQWYVVHALAIVLGILGGQDVTWQWLAPPEKYEATPAGAGFPLIVVYAVWAVAVLVLAPITARYAQVRQRRGGSLRYF